AVEAPGIGRIVARAGVGRAAQREDAHAAVGGAGGGMAGGVVVQAVGGDHRMGADLVDGVGDDCAGHALVVGVAVKAKGVGGINAGVGVRAVQVQQANQVHPAHAGGRAEGGVRAAV